MINLIRNSRASVQTLYYLSIRKRYLEYLCELIQNNKLDPVPIMTLHNIKQELERRKFPNPEIDRGPYEDDEAFLSKCRAVKNMNFITIHCYTNNVQFYLASTRKGATSS